MAPQASQDDSDLPLALVVFARFELGGYDQLVGTVLRCFGSLV